MKFTDAVAVSGKRRTTDGYLVAEARSVRTGVQLYAGSEVGKPEMPVVRVYRPADQVFAQDSLQSFSHAPVTMDHPEESVTADNWKQLAVGEVSTAAKKDGEWVHLPLILKDAAAIQDVESGKCELSAGYDCELVWGDGVTADGHPYDARQQNIKINHLAIVDRARAGSQARIGDSAITWGAAPISTNDKETVPMTDVLRTVVVDGLSVSTTDQGAQAIAKLMKDLESSAAKFADAEKTGATTLADAEKAHAAAIAAKDAALAEKDKQLAAKDAALDAEKAKVLSDADLDKRVAARASLVTIAGLLAKDVKFDGLSDAAIRKAVVTTVLGDAAVKDKADAYIDARFEILAEDAVKKAADGDPLRDALAGGLVHVGDGDKAVTDAYTKMIADMHAGNTTATAK
ncbi:DUF2213 domain-containing protein [Rhizobium sp. rho-13.1]|uniref:DUF2213 domain-containing protein n=1 Tax=Rhizobium sp. rho-13.1 TaxID=2506431 RepID=UPI00115E6E0F|nr:DUF2213 domain-containing protein [Rhizobium sp. rho-13.1]TQX91309.1 DUF2213 domain-containing protein [Rhizobium sp. rho-13.1]